jgi:plasmid stabilization system protein ParE
MEMTIIWNKNSQISLKNSLKRIAEDSIIQAENVEKSILEKINSLEIYPYKFPLDKYRFENDGSFRAFEEKNHRISYRVLNDKIRILRIRHVKQRPKLY